MYAIYLEIQNEKYLCFCMKGRVREARGEDVGMFECLTVSLQRTRGEMNVQISDTQQHRRAR